MGTPREVFIKGVTAFNSRDRAAWMTLCTHDVLINRKPAGVAGWLWHYDVLCDAFADCRLEITSSAEEGDSLGYEVAFTGTHTGILRIPVLQSEVTGKSVKVDYAGFIKIVDRKVRSLNIYGLDCALAQQLDVTLRRR